MQPWRTRSAVATLLVLGALVSACGEFGPMARIHTDGGPVDVALEVVRTPAALAQGLMYRTELADRHGMLFVFPEDRDHHFWMKNTLIPLDMLFIASDGSIVGIHRNATPLSTAQIAVGRPSRYVL